MVLHKWSGKINERNGNEFPSVQRRDCLAKSRVKFCINFHLLVLCPELGRKSQLPVCLDKGLGSMEVEHPAASCQVVSMPPAIPRASPGKEAG